MSDWIRPIEGKSAVLTFEDGTSITCLVNETAYKPQPALTAEFVDNLPDGEIKVTLTDENVDEEYRTTEMIWGPSSYIQFIDDTDNEWIYISGRSELEKVTNELAAKLDYLAMMLDVDIDPEA